MSDQPKPVNPPPPNVVLRGGPLDGGQLLVHKWEPLKLPSPSGDQQCVYRPSGELDAECPPLVKFVFERADPA